MMSWVERYLRQQDVVTGIESGKVVVGVIRIVRIPSAFPVLRALCVMAGNCTTIRA